MQQPIKERKVIRVFGQQYFQEIKSESDGSTTFVMHEPDDIKNTFTRCGGCKSESSLAKVLKKKSDIIMVRYSDSSDYFWNLIFCCKDCIRDYLLITGRFTSLLDMCIKTIIDNDIEYDCVPDELKERISFVKEKKKINYKCPCKWN